MKSDLQIQHSSQDSGYCSNFNSPFLSTSFASASDKVFIPALPIAVSTK